MLDLQMISSSEPATTRQTRSMTGEVHIRKVSGAHTTGNDAPKHQTQTRVGEILGLFKTVSTKNTLYEEQAVSEKLQLLLHNYRWENKQWKFDHSELAPRTTLQPRWKNRHTLVMVFTEGTSTAAHAGSKVVYA